MHTPKILIVDDDPGIRELLSQFLKTKGFEPIEASDGTGLFQMLEQHKVDLIILDILTPGDDGLTLCRQIRQTSRIPIIMLTAVSEELDRILGLELGADDYLSKPFNPRELLARIKAILRRSQFVPDHAEKSVASSCYAFDEWVLDEGRRVLMGPDGELTISSGEFSLLVIFLKNPKRVLSRDDLLEITKQRAAGPFDRSIDIQISRLRHKLEKDPKNPTLIKTIRGAGYMLATAVRVTEEVSS